MKRTMIIILLAVTASCFADIFDVDSVYKGWEGDHDTIVVACDSTYTEAQKDSIRDACDRWNSAGCYPKLKFFYPLGTDAHIYIRNDSTLGPGTCGECRVKPSWNEPYTSSTIGINPSRHIGLGYLVTHEMGHSLGLNDVDYKACSTDVMRGVASDSLDGELSPHDSAEIRSAAEIASRRRSKDGFNIIDLLFPESSLGLGSITSCGFRLPSSYPPGVASLAVIDIYPLFSPGVYIPSAGRSICADTLKFDAGVEAFQWSGVVFLDISIDFPEPYEDLELFGRLYTNIEPVSRCSFTCWFDWETIGGETYIYWEDRDTYPYARTTPLRANVTDCNGTHFNLGGGPFILDDLPEGANTIELVVDDYQGNVATYSEVITVLSAEETNHLTPAAMGIFAYPNPFNSSVTIAIDGGRGLINQTPTIEIFDLNGRRIERIPSAPLNKRGVEPRETGRSSYIWQPSPSVSSGVYLVRARVDGGAAATKRVVYLK